MKGENCWQPTGESGNSPLYVSALTGEGLEKLKGRLRRLLFENYETFRLRIPRNRVELTSSLARQAIIITRTETTRAGNIR